MLILAFDLILVLSVRHRDIVNVDSQVGLVHRHIALDITDVVVTVTLAGLRTLNCHVIVASDIPGCRVVDVRRVLVRHVLQHIRQHVSVDQAAGSVLILAFDLILVLSVRHRDVIDINS